MAEKEIGVQELVFCTITDIVDGAKGNKSIKFKHLSGTPSDHAWTTDKNKYKNCYNDLEPGNNYLIVTTHVGPRRWVWNRCWIMSKKELQFVMKHCGACPDYETFEDVMLTIKALRNPPASPALDAVIF